MTVTLSSALQDPQQGTLGQPERKEQVLTAGQPRAPEPGGDWLLGLRSGKLTSSSHLFVPKGRCELLPEPWAVQG